ncbi:hypothetical protein GH733_006554, partial [Mirounga leonina]
MAARNSTNWMINVNFTEKCMVKELATDALGEEGKGYMVQISGGNNKQGFPMKQGTLTHDHVHLLLSKGHYCYRQGLEKESTNLYKDIPGLTDTTVPHCLACKRASRIHKLCSLSKEDDACPYVVRKPLNKEGKKARTKVPKIQHLVTPPLLQHKCRHIALKKQHTKKNKDEAAEYAKLLAKRMMEAKEKCQEQTAKRQR